MSVPLFKILWKIAPKKQVPYIFNTFIILYSVGTLNILYCCMGLNFYNRSVLGSALKECRRHTKCYRITIFMVENVQQKDYENSDMVRRDGYNGNNYYCIHLTLYYIIEYWNWVKHGPDGLFISKYDEIK